MSSEVIDLIDRLRAGGCVFELAGDAVDVDGPEDVLTDEVFEILRGHREEITDLLASENSIGIVCPWCRSRAIIDDLDGVRCGDCDRVAWLVTEGGGLVRADCADEDFEGVDPVEVGICSSCGDLRDVQRLDGQWYCSRCDVTAEIRRSFTLRHLAAVERARKTPQVRRRPVDPGS
jgi:hypothetical protein